MRGEDFPERSPTGGAIGSPPHARGRRSTSTSGRPATGITPACAGKTGVVETNSKWDMDHPRMRGEDNYAPYASTNVVGSPPHARGRRDQVKELYQFIRITPACAGKTFPPTTNRRERRDHPRMRGEDTNAWETHNENGGSPPHARG